MEDRHKHTWKDRGRHDARDRTGRDHTSERELRETRLWGKVLARKDEDHAEALSRKDEDHAEALAREEEDHAEHREAMKDTPRSRLLIRSILNCGWVLLSNGVVRGTR
jgi:hypothetical protein